MILSRAGCASRPNPNPPRITHPNLTPVVLPDLDTIKGSFRNQIGILEQNMPRARSEGYVLPTREEQTDFVELVSILNTGDFARAVDLATGNGYTLNDYVDRGDNYAISYLLREQSPIQKGWGLYAFRMDSANNIVIEAPHPMKGHLYTLSLMKRFARMMMLLSMP